MPRYYFHIRDQGIFVPDEEGSELPDPDAARQEARESAHELAIDHLKARKKLGEKMLEVADDAGTVIATVKLREVID